jgi:predicted dehydrogenase
MNTIRIGIIGLGANTRLRHVPGLQACPGVEIHAVCNRSSESTRLAAEQFRIPRTFAHWRDLVADSDLDAIVIGTWPYLHAEITMAALDAGKHVLTEARMARDVDEARAMLAASRRHPQLVTQVVPSPFGLGVDRVVKELLAGGFLGELREVVVLGVHHSLADSQAPLHWRQSTRLSGHNVLTLGILHETLIRWVPDPVRVMAQSQIFTPHRRDPDTGQSTRVDVPDALHVLTEIRGGARGVYRFSGVAHFGPGTQIYLYGSEGTLQYSFAGGADQLRGARRGASQLSEIPIPPGQAGRWRVEEEFIEAIRGHERVQFTDFATGVRYMEFTTAVARSANSGQAVTVDQGEPPSTLAAVDRRG